MRKILVCCSAIGVLAVASPAAYAGGKGHHGNGNGAHQNHTCQGGHNCNVTVFLPGEHHPYPKPAPHPTPKPTPPPPKPAPAPAPNSTSTSSSSSNSTSSSTTVVNVTNVTNVSTNVTVSAPASAPACLCPAPVVHRRAHARRHCRAIRVVRYRKVWHHGRDCCGRRVSWYTYKKIRRHRRVCV
jgi:hypothetical protein